MSIDWITVLAQLINFLLLVWLLKRFLYGPILAGIDAREAEIAQRINAADTAQEQANAAKVHYQQLHAQLVAIQEEKVAEALRITKNEREQLLAEARAQREQEHENWRRHLEHEGQEFMTHLQNSGATILWDLTRKALHELGDENLEAAIVRQLGQRLQPLVKELGAAASSSQQATISTQQALLATTQTDLVKELRRILPSIEPRFIVDTNQSPGVVIEIGSVHLEWTMDSYIDELNTALTHVRSRFECTPKS